MPPGKPLEPEVLQDDYWMACGEFLEQCFDALNRISESIMTAGGAYEGKL
jgi:hypothetical protein